MDIEQEDSKTPCRKYEHKSIVPVSKNNIGAYSQAMALRLLHDYVPEIVQYAIDADITELWNSGSYHF